MQITLRIFVTLCFLSFVSGTGHAQGTGQTRIGIMKFEVSGELEAGLSTFLYDTLMEKAVSCRKYVVIDWEQIDRILSYLATSQPNLSPEEARKQAINQLGIEKMYVGSVTKVGSSIHVTVKVLNLDLTVEKSVRETARNTDGLEAAMVKIGAQLYGDTSAKTAPAGPKPASEPAKTGESTAVPPAAATTPKAVEPKAPTDTSSDKPKATIMKFEISEGLDPNLSKFLYEAFMQGVVSTGHFQIVDWEEIDRLQKFQATSQPNLSPEDAKKQAMHQLGIQKLFLGTLTKVGTSLQIIVKMLNLDLSVDRAVRDSARNEDGLDAAIKNLARKVILSPEEARKTQEPEQKPAKDVRPDSPSEDVKHKAETKPEGTATEKTQAPNASKQAKAPSDQASHGQFLALLARDGWSEARTHFEETIAKNPDDQDARAGLVIALYLNDDLENAKYHLRRLKEMEAKSPYVRVASGLMKGIDQKYDEGVYELNRSLEDGCNASLVQLCLGIVADVNGNRAQLKKVLEAYKELVPEGERGPKFKQLEGKTNLAAQLAGTYIMTDASGTVTSNNSKITFTANGDVISATSPPLSSVTTTISNIKIEGANLSFDMNSSSKSVWAYVSLTYQFTADLSSGFEKIPCTAKMVAGTHGEVGTTMACLLVRAK